MRFFVSEISDSISNLSPPLFVVGSCEDYEKCSPDVYSALLHKTCISQLNNDNRKAEMLEWILAERNFSVDGSLDDIIRKTNGFHFADLNALVSVAVKYSYCYC